MAGFLSTVTSKGLKTAKALGKHAEDLKTKKTPQQKNTESLTKNQRTYREGQRKAGIAGGVIGAATAAGTSLGKKENKTESKNEEVKKSKDTRSNSKDYPTYKKSTESAAAFRNAFKKAKESDKKTFTFEGRSYKVEDGSKQMMKGGYGTKKMMGGGYSMKGKK